MNKDILIHSDYTIKESLKQLEIASKKVLLVLEGDSKLIGTINDGDIRRALISGKKLNDSISEIFIKNPIYIYKTEYNNDKIKKIFLEEKIALLPIVDKELNIIDYVTWDEFFSDTRFEFFDYEKIDIPAVIMAGGKGTRLEPFTAVLPKPLIPVNGKTIIEHIIEQFYKFGVKKYYLTLNYLGEMIKAYFSSLKHDFDISYIFEKDFNGTAGSLTLLPNDISDNFIVSNCDTLLKANYAEALRFHNDSNASLTILSSIHHHKIPYGVIDFEKDGIVTNIREKPETTFAVNTGVYIIHKTCLKRIPENTIFHMTDLIENLLKNKKKVLTFLVNSDDFVDVGQWEEYHKTVRKLNC